MSWVDQATILRGVVGSSAHGLALAGTDDRDEMGIAVEPLIEMIGLNRNWGPNGFEQYIRRTAEERAAHDPEADQRYAGRTPPSQAGDLDLTIYSLRKYCRLAADGNPSVLVLLFCPDAEMDRWGALLRAEREMFASRRAGARFLGYLMAQKERLQGRRGQMRVTRTELVEKHGYDTKYAMHMVRLGFQGCEYLRRGKLTLPMDPAHEGGFCLYVRRGEAKLDEVIHEVEIAERQLCLLTYGQPTLPQTAAARRDYSQGQSPLPVEPDWERINEFMSQTYRAVWAGQPVPQ